MRNDREVIASGKPQIIAEEQLTSTTGETRIYHTTKIPFQLPDFDGPALLGVAAVGGATLWVVMAGLFLANACLGLVIPTTMVMALDAHGDVAGMASSLGGTLQMLAGGAMIALTAPFFDGTALPMLAAIALCGVLAFGLSRLARA